MMPPEEYEAALRQQAQAAQQEKVMQQQYEQSQALRNKPHQQAVPTLMGGLGAGGVGGALQALSTGMDNAQGFKESKRLEQAMSGMGEQMNAGNLKKAMADYQNTLHNQEMDKEKMRLARARNQIERAKLAQANRLGPDGMMESAKSKRTIPFSARGSYDSTIKLRDSVGTLMGEWKPEYGNFRDIPGMKTNDLINAASRGQWLEYIAKHTESEEFASFDKERKEAALWWAKLYKTYINPEIKETSGAAVSAFEQARNDIGNALSTGQAPEMTAARMKDIYNTLETEAQGQFMNMWDMRSPSNTASFMNTAKRHFGEDFLLKVDDKYVGMIQNPDYTPYRWDTDESGRTYNFGKFNPKFGSDEEKKQFYADPIAVQHETAKRMGWIK